MFDIDWHNANWVDYGIITMLVLSVLMGVIRGFIRESMSLVTWVAAILIAYVYYEPVSEYFTRISTPIFRWGLAAILLVLAVLILGGILSHMLGRLIRFTKFGATDRVIGTAFGFLRGVLVVAVIVLLLNPTPLTKDKLWQQSALIPRFQPMAAWLQGLIPKSWLAKLKGIVPDEWHPADSTEPVKNALEQNLSMDETEAAVEQILEE